MGEQTPLPPTATIDSQRAPFGVGAADRLVRAQDEYGFSIRAPLARYFVCFIAWCIEQCEVWWVIIWWLVQLSCGACSMRACGYARERDERACHCEQADGL